MEKKFLKTIKKYNMLNNGDTVIVGLSGGCDSVAMFRLLHKYKDTLAINIIAVHINHLMRSDSTLDEEFCKNLCKSYDVPIYTYKINIEDIAKNKKMSSEEVGREERYKTFNSLVKDESYKIAIAHNKNDVAETFLMRLFRGAGINGLKSIAPTRDNIIRPIIEIERKDLERYLNSLSQNYCTDSTNLLPIYTRNKIRLNLLPTIQKDFNKNIVSTLYDTSKILEEEQDFIESIATKTFENITCYKENSLYIDLKKFKTLHPYLQKQILLKSTSIFVPNNKNISKKHLYSIINIINNTSNGERNINLPNNTLVQKSYNNLIFKYNKPTTSVREQSLKLNDFIYIEEINKYIYVTIIDNTIYENYYNNTLNLENIIQENNISKDLKLNIVKSSVFCYDSVYDYLQLKVRCRQQGDKISIKNLGTKKLKDYFIDKKIPKDLRDSIPLLALNSEILWILDDFNTVNNKYLTIRNHKMLIILMEAN